MVEKKSETMCGGGVKREIPLFVVEFWMQLDLP